MARFAVGIRSSHLETSEVERLRKIITENTKLKRSKSLTLLKETALEGVPEKKWEGRHRDATLSRASRP